MAEGRPGGSGRRRRRRGSRSRERLRGAGELDLGPVSVDEKLRSDEEIAAYRIGPPEILNAPIFLAEYDPAWPDLFEREQERIQAALGDRAELIEHVGSTSVPGLAAKPKIDIILAVPDSSDEPPTSRRSRPRAMSCGSANPTGTSTGSSRVPTPT